MPATALNHFQQDLARAGAIVAHAAPLPEGTPAEQLLRSDLLRSGWMFAVGAFDAYFCDAYTDVVAATIIAKSRHPALTLPEFFHDIRFPVRAILEPYANNVNWRWRMAARKMMERETVLSLPAIQTLFNKFFRSGQKFFRDLLPNWIVHSGVGHRRLIGISASRFNTLPANLRGSRSQMPRPRWRNVSARSSSGGTTASTTVIAPRSSRGPSANRASCFG